MYLLGVKRYILCMVAFQPDENCISAAHIGMGIV